MNFKRTMRFSGVAVCICSASLADNADAQTAGSITTSVGWLHIAPQGDATPLIVQSVGGVTVNRQLAGTGAHASSTDTLGITTEYYVTDNLGVAMLLGMPLKVNLIGDGRCRSMARSARQGRCRPPSNFDTTCFLPRRNSGRTGIGANYTWFTQVRATNSQFVSDSFGPGGSARATLSSSWNPVFGSGQITRFQNTGRSAPPSTTCR